MTDPVRLLHADLAEALFDARFSLHDCADPGTPAGGVCLTPSTVGPPDGGAGIIVSWGVGARLRLDDDRYLTYQAVLDEMNTTLGVLLIDLGFEVRAFGQAGAHVVVGRRSDVEAPDDLALDQLR